MGVRWDRAGTAVYGERFLGKVDVTSAPHDSTGARDRWFRWEEWTLLRLLAAFLWILVSATVGLALWRAAAFGSARLFGTPPSADILRTAARYALGGTVVLGAGPLGVWLLRRRRLWLVLALIVLGIGILWTTSLWIRSLSAPVGPI